MDPWRRPPDGTPIAVTALEEAAPGYIAVQGVNAYGLALSAVVPWARSTADHLADELLQSWHGIAAGWKARDAALVSYATDQDSTDALDDADHGLLPT